MKKVLAEYKNTPGHVKVTMQTMPDDNAQYLQRLVTLKLGNSMPDIVENIDTLVNQMAAANITTDLSPYLSKGSLTTKSFLPSFLNAYRPLDKPDEIQGMPVGADAYVLYYNKDLFKQYGVALPTDSWTWQDFYAASKKITKAGKGKVYGFVGSGLPQPTYNPILHSYGVAVYDRKTHKSGVGSPAAIKAWEFMLKPYQDGTYASYKIGSSPSAPDFASGKVAMYMGARKNVPTFRNQLKADWDVAPIPLLNGKRPIGGGSFGISITKASKSKDADWKFLTWFFANDGGMKILEQNYETIPATNEGLDSGSWRKLPGPPSSVNVFSEADKSAFLAPQLPQAAQGILNTSLKTATEQVLLKGESVKEAFTAAGKAVNKALKEGS